MTTAGRTPLSEQNAKDGQAAHDARMREEGNVEGRMELRQEQKVEQEQEQVVRLFQTLGRVEAKLESIETETRDAKEYARDISVRVRSLEVSRGWFVGAGAGAGALMAWIIKLFG